MFRNLAYVRSAKLDTLSTLTLSPFPYEHAKQAVVGIPVAVGARLLHRLNRGHCGQYGGREYAKGDPSLSPANDLSLPMYANHPSSKQRPRAARSVCLMVKFSRNLP